MRQKVSFWLLGLAVVLLALACNLSTSPQLASTPTRESSPSVPVVLPTATQPLQGMIAGTLMYPSEYIPPLRVVAFSVNDLSVYYSILTSENQSKFEIPVPPGTYYVVAYLLDGSLAGGYSQAVPCGLQYGCDDHSLIPVVVRPGERVSNVNPHDWYAPAGAFPPMP